jgi:acyl-CoA reductase-like NAD-dependent aldehyde dehydrogenase
MKDYKMYIGGEWVDALSGETLTTLNPATEEPYAIVPSATSADVDRAVKAANGAFPAWSSLRVEERSSILVKMAEAIRAHADEFIELEMSEHGTPRPDAFGATMGAASKFEWSAYAAQRIMGEQLPVEDNTLSYVKRTPAGIVGIITPWNLPTIMIAVKLSAVLATGNTCILKPPSINSSIALHFAEVLSGVEGVPPGTINVITGPGGSVGDAIARHPGINMLGFTGSSETGQSIMAAASSTVKKCVMELGGNNPVLIMADADIDAALKILAWRQFNNSGQHCSGPGRYYVHESRYEEFVAKFRAAAEAVTVGDPATDGVTMGPVVSAAHQHHVLAYIQGAVSEGAQVVTGGKLRSPGFFVEPTVIAGCTHDMKIAREEVFGPVAVIIKYTDKDNLVEWANDSNYGLCAHVWTKDVGKGMKLIDQLQAGAVFINTQMLTNEQPWGTSVKQSGIGKEGGMYGLLEFTDQKLVCIRYA